jgi:hypothetical protein
VESLLKGSVGIFLEHQLHAVGLPGRDEMSQSTSRDRVRGAGAGARGPITSSRVIGALTVMTIGFREREMWRDCRG